MAVKNLTLSAIFTIDLLEFFNSKGGLNIWKKTLQSASQTAHLY